MYGCRIVPVQSKEFTCENSRLAALYKAAIAIIAKIYPGAKLEVKVEKVMPVRPEIRVKSVLKLLKIMKPFTSKREKRRSM